MFPVDIFIAVAIVYFAGVITAFVCGSVYRQKQKWYDRMDGVDLFCFSIGWFITIPMWLTNKWCEYLDRNY